MRIRAGCLAAAISVLAAAVGCASPNPSRSARLSHVVRVVAVENVWGSIASQVGGAHAEVTSIITNPATDPHAYEPTPADGRAIASADLIIVNGIGYDGWASKLVSANGGGQKVVSVGVAANAPAGGNPHRWYNPADVETVAAAVATQLGQLDPAATGYFQARLTQFETVALNEYHDLIATIRARYSGTAVGASESIFSMLAPALGLTVLTPDSFLKAITQGTDVSSADKTTIDNQIKNRLIKIYVYNSQNTTPDVAAQLKECQFEGIPTPAITESLVPPAATYQDWQVRQLRSIQSALAQATGQ